MRSRHRRSAMPSRESMSGAGTALITGGAGFVGSHLADVRDADAVQRALHGVDAVFHFASAVGVGQSMYQIERYTDINNRGTAVLLEALSHAQVSRLVVASSMSLYGEGLLRRSREPGRAAAAPAQATVAR